MAKLELSDNARTVLEARYLLRDPAGKVCESPEELFARVATAVAAPEGKSKAAWKKKFLELMVSRRFLPNSPTLMNAGKKLGQLSACFVLPVADSLDDIFDSLKYAAKIHQSGGGTGFSFSRLRSDGSAVKSTHGIASGPVSFIRIFDQATEIIKQGGARRGANMAILNVDHPDIEAFIDAKRDQRSIMNFNVSIGITDDFMAAVESGRPYALKRPGTDEVVRTVDAALLLERACQAAWECGDPGLVFLDRMNAFNPTPEVGRFESTNPCGEQPLLPYESCNLGSLNLGLYIKGSNVDWRALERDINTAVRFLDNVITINCYPIAQSRAITLKNRKIGLGVMGFADLLLLLGVPYDSPEGLAWGERIMSFVDREAKRASARLARTRGAFAHSKGSLWERLGYPKLRNATVSTVAPTGTISIIAGASSGIEPIFAGVFYRNVLSGARLREVHPSVERAMIAKGLDPSKAEEADVASALGDAWRPAHHVPIEAHVRMQAAFQRHSDSSVSKTINLPFEATRDDVLRAYKLAYYSGCKGITVYRDRSRGAQVLETAAAYCPSC